MKTEERDSTHYTLHLILSFLKIIKFKIFPSKLFMVYRQMRNGMISYIIYLTLHCSSFGSQLPLQLKKETINSNLQWTAGCTTNCSGQTPCKATTQPPCHLECCNVTMTSCLWLNGTLNVPSFATRGPHLNTELMASLLCTLSITLLL